MNEWTVVTALATLVALAGAVIAPILKLSGTISKLSVLIDGALKDMVRMRSNLEETETKLHGLEHRVTVLEVREDR